jgi:hypothetical protein
VQKRQRGTRSTDTTLTPLQFRIGCWTKTLFPRASSAARSLPRLATWHSYNPCSVIARPPMSALPCPCLASFGQLGRPRSAVVSCDEAFFSRCHTDVTSLRTNLVLGQPFSLSACFVEKETHPMYSSCSEFLSPLLTPPLSRHRCHCNLCHLLRPSVRQRLTRHRFGGIDTVVFP